MQDLRHICGTDIRRVGLWPEDMSRAESVTRQYGGSITAFPVGLAAVCIEWHAPNGQTVVVTAATAAQALQLLTQQIRQ
jgi:hypothetical protein